jgi:hypothetical protein
VVDDLSSGSYLMDIQHCGYTAFVNGKEPNKSVWIELTDGTIVTNRVVSSVEVSATVERLTMETAWATTTLESEINRVSFLRLSRIADDSVEFIHNSTGESIVTLRVMAVPV